jgi:xanthine dehydrogenase YagS FAD-binding subunit
MRDGLVRNAGIALGGVAHKPWRVKEAEAALIGRPLDDAALSNAADLVLRGAKPYRDNAFKVELARRAMVRALRTAGETA